MVLRQVLVGIVNCKKVLIVDDINDSGATINWVKADWENTIQNKIQDDIDYVWDSIWNKSTKFAVLV